MTYIKPPASHECTWRSGPPPEVGWWPASFASNPTTMRWWDGKMWSFAATHVYSMKSAGAVAPYMCSQNDSSQIKWTDRWWLK